MHIVCLTDKDWQAPSSLTSGQTVNNETAPTQKVPKLGRREAVKAASAPAELKRTEGSSAIDE